MRQRSLTSYSSHMQQSSVYEAADGYLRCNTRAAAAFETLYTSLCLKVMHCIVDSSITVYIERHLYTV
jgi:hypothetical protein